MMLDHKRCRVPSGRLRQIAELWMVPPEHSFQSDRMHSLRDLRRLAISAKLRLILRIF